MVLFCTKQEEFKAASLIHCSAAAAPISFLPLFLERSSVCPSHELQLAALAFLPASRGGRLDAETERERSDLSSKGVKICSVSAKVVVGGKKNRERGMNDEDEIEPWLVALLCRDAATAEAGTWWGVLMYSKNCHIFLTLSPGKFTSSMNQSLFYLKSLGPCPADKSGEILPRPKRPND